jgi:ArsR family transcriptional regulator, cadmium/lead-responsive transcriptional repressor
MSAAEAGLGDIGGAARHRCGQRHCPCRPGCCPSPARQGQAGALLVIEIKHYHREMAMMARDVLAGRSGLAPAAALFRSLGDTTRLAIVRRLADGGARVVDLTAELGLAQSTVSGHLACLRECGLVESRPQGRACVYSLAEPALMDLLAAAETVLAGTGGAVALCPAYGQRR